MIEKIRADPERLGGKSLSPSSFFAAFPFLRTHHLFCFCISAVTCFQIDRLVHKYTPAQPPAQGAAGSPPTSPTS